MARTQVPSRSTSARRVTLLAHGMRPLTVTAPPFSSSRASVDEMAIAAAADVAARVHGLAAYGAVGPSRLHQLRDASDESLRLLAGDAHARGGGLLARALAFLLFLEQLVRFHDDAVVVVVVAHPQGGHDPRGFGKLEQVHVGGHRALGRPELGDEPGEIVAERLHLSLLALEGDEHAVRRGADADALEEIERRADGVRHRGLDGVGV